MRHADIDKLEAAKPQIDAIMEKCYTKEYPYYDRIAYYPRNRTLVIEYIGMIVHWLPLQDKLEVYEGNAGKRTYECDAGALHRRMERGRRGFQHG